MKKSIFYAAALLLASTGFTSCDDDWQRPPVVLPEATIEANTTILELKQAFDQDVRDFATPIVTKANGEHYIVKGLITSNDETGNIYNKVFIEDETAGLCFSIYVSKLYESYRYGQEIVVDCTGLYIGNYGNMLQVGGAPTGTYANPGRMSEALWTAAANVDGLADPDKVTAATLTIPQINAFKNNREEFLAWTGRYIKIENLHFQKPGEVMGESGKSNNTRNLVDEAGNVIALNNSGYSTWSQELTPDGSGDVYAILSYFNNNWQLLLSDLDDLVGFTPYVAPEKPDPSKIAVGSFSMDFTPDVSSFPEYWSTVYNSSAKGGWFLRTFNGNAYASATGYNNGSAPFDLWLISQPVDAAKMTEKVLEFETQVNGYGAKTSSIEVYILSSDDPASAKLTKLEANFATPPASGYSDWANSGKISLEQASGVFYIGWRYQATADANFATWCVDKISVK